jgi:hypothetical protein
MIGYETERRLKTFLLTLGEGEQYIERYRLRLCSIKDFCPYSVFQRLDRDANERVSAYEILNFLKDNNVYSITERECSEFITYYDSNNDGKLTFKDFKQIVLPCEDNKLRKTVLKRKSARCGRWDFLPVDIEQGLATLIEKEIEFARRLDSYKHDLNSRYDFTPYAAFKSIDKLS